MLREYFAKGSSSAEPAADSKKKDEKVAKGKVVDFDDDPEPNRELTPEEIAKEKKLAMKRKLKEIATEHNGPSGGGQVTYDSLCRSLNRILMEGHTTSTMEMHDGIQIATAKGFQNAQLQNKWTFGNPQQASWETNLAMNGFSDAVSAMYSTMGRAQLTYQRMFRSGALFVGQFIMQPTPMGMQGTLFSLFQYPWVPHGCSTFVYLKGQHVQASHTSRIVRGLHVGAQITYDLNQGSTSTHYAASTTSSDKTTHWAAEIKPDTGEWRFGMSKAQWVQDVEVGAQLDVKDKRQGKVSSLSIGVRKPLIGGGSIHAVLSNFKAVKAVLELPFGLDRSQVKVQYCIQYDIPSGGAKHGLTLNL